jgi:hypothetical protein
MAARYLPSLRTAKRRTDRFVRLVRAELATGSTVSLRDRLRMITAGFLSESHLLYQFYKNDRTQYVTDYQRWVRTPDINGEYRVLLDDKLLFALVTSNSFPLHQVESFGVTRTGRPSMPWTRSAILPNICWLCSSSSPSS